MKIKSFSILAILLISISFSFAQKQKNTFVLIETNLGNIKIKLYNETPQHRDNFVKLVKEKYYDSIIFHRVIKDFMIQAGDPNSKNAKEGTMLGSGGPGYTVPAEFNPALFHKKGALAAARTGDDSNPLKASSGSQFYIVQGKPYSDSDLDKMEQNRNMMIKNNWMRDYIFKPENQELLNQLATFQQEKNEKAMDSMIVIVETKVDELHKNDPKFAFTKEQRDTYRSVGGTPFLDMEYTVFGEVVKGIEIVDKIAAVKTGQNDRPQENVVIKKMTIKKK